MNNFFFIEMSNEFYGIANLISSADRSMVCLQTPKICRALQECKTQWSLEILDRRLLSIQNRVSNGWYEICKSFSYCIYVDSSIQPEGTTDGQPSQAEIEAKKQKDFVVLLKENVPIVDLTLIDDPR